MNRLHPYLFASLLCSLLLALLLLGCGSGGAKSASARIGDLTITDAYIPAPASPDVAAVYFTVKNNGAKDDALVGATSPVAQSASLHNEMTMQGGSMMMMPLQEIAIPAHQTVSLRVGGMHLMLENLKQKLQKGQHVQVTLQFKNAGSLTLNVPVTDAGGMNGM